MKRVLVLIAILSPIGPHQQAALVQADWPMFIGDGDRTPTKKGTALVDHLDDAPVLWELKHHMGVGKGLYPGHLKLSKEHNIEPFYGGASSPIVAEGTVFVSYFKPDGKVRSKVESWRTVSEPQKYLPPWFFSVTADDILLAVDARTGKIKWERIEKGKGHNRLGHKRGHWCVSPAYADGCVFSMGTAGSLYAYDATSGKKLWETVAEPSLQQQREEYLQSRKLSWTASEESSLVVAGNVVVVPRQRLTGYDVRTGKQRWRIDDKIVSRHATPAFWRHDGHVYLVVNDGQGKLRLIDPSDGTILWTLDGLGQQIGTVTVTGDLAILNVGSRTAASEKADGLFGAFRLGLHAARRRSTPTATGSSTTTRSTPCSAMTGGSPARSPQPRMPSRNRSRGREKSRPCHISRIGCLFARTCFSCRTRQSKRVASPAGCYYS